MLLKRILFCVFGEMQCFYGLRGSRLKKPIIFHIQYIIVAPLCPAVLKRVHFLQSSSFWEARCSLIGQLTSALWLAEYLKHETEILRALPYCKATSRLFYSLWSRHDETKTIEPAIKRHVAFSEDIITDYNDLYCLFTHCVTPCKHNTMSAFVIRETF